MANTVSGNTLAEVASLIGDVARANMLSALMGGRALSAGELSYHAGVTAQTTSGHLAKMTEAGLIAVAKQGRHRYYRIASPEVAQAIDALMAVAGGGSRRHRPVGPKDQALRLARTCYDHMAGRLALAVTDALVQDGHVVLSDGAGIVTDEGQGFFAALGLDLSGPSRTHRPLCRTCLDWSERRPHLAGRLGAGLLATAMERGWVSTIPESRALRITRAGEMGLAATFRLPSDWREELPV